MTVVGLARRARSWLPPPGPARAFAVVALVNSAGTGFLLAGATVFYLRVVGLSPAQIGFGLAVASAVGFAGAVPTGRLADRAGARATMVGLHAWRAVWCAVLAFITGPFAFVIVLTCISVANTAFPPVSRAVVAAAVEPAERTRTLAFMRSAQNVGLSAGAALSAPLIALHTVAGARAIVLADAASFALAAWLLSQVRLRAAPARPARTSVFSVPGALRDGWFLALAGLDGLLSLHVTLLGMAIPLWILRQTRAPAVLVPGVVFANTALVALLQVGFAQRGDSAAGGRRSMGRAGLALAACCLLLAASWHTRQLWASALLLAAAAALTIAELSQQAGSWTLSLRFSAPDSLAEHLAVFSLGATAQEVLGPPLLGTVVLAQGRLGWIVLAGVFVAAAAAVRPLTLALERRALARSPG